MSTIGTSWTGQKFDIAMDRVRLERDGILLISNIGPIGFRCEAGSGQIARLLDLLAGVSERKLGPQDLSIEDHQRIQALVDLLETAGILRMRHRSDESAGENAPQANGYLIGSHVLIAGVPSWAVVSALAMAAAGVRSITLCGDEAMTADGPLKCYLGGETAGKSRAEALKRRIGNVAPECDVRMDTDPLSVASHLPGLLRAEHPLAVGAMAPARLDLQMAVEQECRRTGVPFFGVELIGPQAMIGPISESQRVGCWFCAKLRLLANAKDNWATRKYAQLSLSGCCPSPPPDDPHTVIVTGHTVASEAIRYLDCRSRSKLLNHVLVQQQGSPDGELFPYLPMPWCEVCGGAHGALERGEAESSNRSMPPARSMQQLLESLPELVNAGTGIISCVMPRDRGVVEPSVPCVVLALPSAYTEVDQSWISETAAGKGINEIDATMGALGEAVERYAASRYRHDALTRATMQELTGDIVDPRNLCLYDETQYDRTGFPFQRFDPEGLHDWVAGRWLDTGREVWVAASQVYYRFRRSFTDFFCQATTNGLAAGSCVETATQHAVLELIERDAVMLAWLCGESGIRLIPESSGDDIARLTDELDRCGVIVELYAVKGAAGVPVVMCLGLGDGKNWPWATATSAANLNLRLAARAALMEMSQTCTALHRMMIDGTGSRPRIPSDVRVGSFLDHATYYISERVGAFDFLRKTPRTVAALPHQTPAIPFCEIPDRLRQEGVRIATIDVTSPDIARCPFRVVRAVATNLLPIHCGYGMERRGSIRLNQRLAGALNQNPHPFC